MPRSCPAKHALQQGYRPQPTTTEFTPCSSRCIFCGIWSLALKISTHQSLSQKYGASSSSQQQRRSPSPTSSIHVETYDPISTSRLLDAQLQTQRARLQSIMSICTVEGAAETEGLEIAFQRCRDTVKKIIYQESVIEDTIRRSSVDRRQERRPERTAERHCSKGYYSGQRRGSRVGITA